MVRKFLYFVAALVFLFIAGSLIYSYFAPQLMRVAFVPSTEFKDQPAPAANAYADPAMWFARAGKTQDNPALWVPAGFSVGKAPKAAVFFIHPTSFMEKSAWNAPSDDKEANDRAKLFLRGQASAFNEVGEIWAPRYRQATLGAFLTSQKEAEKALGVAYRDVASAFDQFLVEAGPDRPIILAGHSQGALHLTRLMREKVAGQPFAKRVVAAYVVGWPISRAHDLAAIGLPECTAADQSGCLLSWQSFAEPADPSTLFEAYDGTTGFDGQSRRGSDMICTNPLTGTANSAAPATANLGTLVPSKDLASADLVKGAVPAKCGTRGLLLIGDPPNVGDYVLPGNNYHVYDYALFWANVRADAAKRLAAFGRE